MSTPSADYDYDGCHDADEDDDDDNDGVMDVDDLCPGDEKDGLQIGTAIGTTTDAPTWTKTITMTTMILSIQTIPAPKALRTGSQTRF